MHSQSLKRDINSKAQPHRFPDGRQYKGISVAVVEQLKTQYGEPGWKIEQAALQEQIIPLRYARNLNAFGVGDQIAVLRSTVGIIGLGGLGGTVAEVLARIGVGRLRLVDGDLFEEHNLNRQLLSRTAGLGKAKADAAVKRVHDINPSVEVVSFMEFLEPSNASGLMAGLDVVVDCLDNLKSRFILQNAARQARIPMISAAVAGATGHVTAIFPDDTGLEGIYGDPLSIDEKGAEVSLGCLPHAVYFLASLEASETIKLLTGKGMLLQNRILLVDLEQQTYDVMML